MSRIERKRVRGVSNLKLFSRNIIASSILIGSLILPQTPFSITSNLKVAEAASSYVVNATILNVRSGPGTNFSKIGSLLNRSGLQVVERLSNGWYKISYNGKTGYVSGQFVKALNSLAPATIYRVNATGLNVRTGPGTQYGKLGLLKNGAIVNVISKESNGWYKINYNGKTGYVSGNYITTGNQATALSTKILNVPLIAQRPELPSGCEATALAMALKYYGVNVDKTTLAKQMPYDSTPLVRNADGSIRTWGDPDVGFVGTPFGNGFTINPAPLKRVLDKYRSGGINLTGQDFSQIEKYISQGKPVLAWFTISHEMPSARTWKTPAGKTINAAKPLHCIVVTGVDANYVYFNDSESLGKNVKIAKSKFISIYNAMGKRALVVN